MNEKQFRIALSFSGADRETAQSIAFLLLDHFEEREIFFDEWHPEEFIGVDADLKLRAIYQERSQYIVPIFSKHYQSRWLEREPDWCGIEWSSIRSILNNKRTRPYVLPIALDETKIPGWESHDLAIRKSARGGDRKVVEKLLKIYNRKADELADVKKPAKSRRTPAGRQIKAGTPKSLSVNDEQGDTNGSEFGFIVVVDINDSSSLPGKKLRQAVRQLWHFPDEFARLEAAKHLVANSILDGVVVAIRKADHNALLTARSQWVKEMAKSAGVAIRVAVHQGQFQIIERERSSQTSESAGQLIVGVGPNECSRLVRVAGPKQILVSENFVRTWVQNQGEEEKYAIFPVHGDSPWEITLKPNVVSQLRLFTGGDEIAGMGSMGQRPPEALQQVHLAKENIDGLLDEIMLDFVQHIRSIDSKLSSQKLAPRASIFVPNVFQSELISTDYRRLLHKSRNGAQVDKKGVTTYSLRPPTGTLGVSFATGDIQFIHGLPAYKKDPIAYVEALTASPWCVDPRIIAKFGRKARTFLAFPISLSDEPRSADGVVCLDCLDPLSEIDPAEIQAIGQLLWMQYGIALAALWRLRA